MVFLWYTRKREGDELNELKHSIGTNIGISEELLTTSSCPQTRTSSKA